MTNWIEAKSPSLSDIAAMVQAGERQGAIDLAIRALERQKRDPQILELVAEGMEQDGLLEEASSLLHEALETQPQNPASLRALSRVQARLGRHEEARETLLTLLKANADDYVAQFDVGQLSMIIGDIPAARRYYARAAELALENPDPLGALANIAAQSGDAKTARAFADRALALRPEAIAPQIAIARAELAQGEPLAAKARLEQLLARSDLDDAGRADALNYIGDAFDALDQRSEAFGAYSARSAIRTRAAAPTLEGDQRAWGLDQARRLAAHFGARSGPEATAGEDREGKNTVRSHVFMIGFPRSGTTLLEQVLGSHPEIATLEERRMLANAGDGFLADAEGLAGLASLSVADADGCRELYWRGVRQALDQDISNKIFIDKNPLNTARLPVIAKLFPRAKIIFALRDPRDVVFSCFRRLFNSKMVEFHTLEGSADYYDQVMTLGELFRQRFPLEFHTVRHEDLIANFDVEARRVLDFVGVGWNDAVRGFAARAANSATPSAGQVARGLNSEGVGQWRRYARPMARILPVIEPWVKRFGYPPTEPELMPSPPDERLPPALARVGAAVGAQNWPAAFAEVDQALAAGLNHPLFYRLRGVRGQQEGKLDQAISDFERALADSPGDFATLNALGLCLARSGRPVEGLGRLETAIAIAPDFAPARYNRGWTLEVMGDLPGARQAYKHALALDPNHAQALANLASLAGRVGDHAEARDYAQRSLALDPGQPAALTALAIAQAAEGDFRGALQRLEPLVAAQSRASEHERAVALGVLGDVLDELDRPADAFKAYAASGAAFRSLYGQRYSAPGRETSLAIARRLSARFQVERPVDWRRPSAAGAREDARSHVFLLGFPRSGTTMLGQALATHPGAVTLEEEDFLGETTQTFIADPRGVDRLLALSPADVARLRDDYWALVRGTGAETAGKIVIDKTPMNTLALPLITKVFPGAKVLFLRRDPRDVVLSCFRQRFAINPTTVEFLTLAGTAALYDAVMDLAETYRRTLDLVMRVQGYETLVEHFDPEMRGICDFVDLEWRTDMADFAARAVDIATPSASQLARGLNTRGVGQWRRYQSELAPVLPTLIPWVERFGYEID